MILGWVPRVWKIAISLASWRDIGNKRLVLLWSFFRAKICFLLSEVGSSGGKTAKKTWPKEPWPKVFFLSIVVWAKAVRSFLAFGSLEVSISKNWRSEPEISWACLKRTFLASGKVCFTLEKIAEELINKKLTQLNHNLIEINDWDFH